ncbi:MAG: FliO/MopB family protein [Alphaproteobacteria bacterium]|nr:FliO/MopB family protein [Alphaproteobacteria bacterium]
MEETSYGMYVQAILSLGFVIGLILITAKLLKAHLDPTTNAGGKKRRLSISESINIDGRNRLLLVRRDDVEHLLIVGGATNLLIEQNIPTPPDFKTVLEEENKNKQKTST